MDVWIAEVEARMKLEYIEIEVKELDPNRKSWRQRQAETEAREKSRDERLPVDFSPAGVPPHQRAMDGRLANWAKWNRSRAHQEVSAGFDRVQSDTWDRREYGVITSAPLDRIDASRVAKGVLALPDKHRAAVQWFYISGRGARDKAAALGVTLAGLKKLCDDARQFLINRGV